MKDDREDGSSCCQSGTCSDTPKPKFKKTISFTEISSSPASDNSTGQDTKQANQQQSACCEDDSCSKPKEVKFKRSLPVRPVLMEQNETKDSCCSGGSCSQADDESQPLLEVNTGIQKDYIVQGMDCPSCAVTIEKHLKGIGHIQGVKVNYGTGKMQVHVGHPSHFDRIPEEMSKIGFTAEAVEASSNSRIYTIEGMDCGACAMTIEKHLESNPGVQQVSVNFSSGKMKIEHDPSVDVVSEMTKIGFKAFPASRKGQQTPADKKQGASVTVLSGALLAIGFLDEMIGMTQSLSTLLYLVSMILAGYKPVKSAYFAIKSKSLDMNVLMSAAAIGAVLIGEWLEGATVVWLFSLGIFLQNKSIERTRNSIRSLMDLAPPEAWVQTGDGLVRKPVEEIQRRQMIVVKPGEKIPLDGEIVNGISSVNQAPITGESIPVDKEPGDPVYAGTINEHGSLEVKVTKLAEDSTLSRIIHLVEEAQEKKAPTQAFVDKFAAVYTPVVFVLAFVVMVFPPLFGWGSWGDWFYKGLELLVVACPCALVISTPVAIVSAIGNAARNGVLIKGGVALEIAGTVDAIAFDKTGTLTEGKPVVSHLASYEGSEEQLISVVRTIEEYSQHPIAKAIVMYAQHRQIPTLQGEAFKAIVGKGAQATIQGTEYFAGNLKLFQELGVALGSAESSVNRLQQEGHTLVLVGTRTKLHGLIAVSDSLRNMTVTAIQKLKHTGIKQMVMLTGDHKGTAQNISRQAGVDRFFAELLPEDKVKAVQQIQKEGRTLAMVGDGINDAPALATANLGIAMGGAGTDTAMETADIVLMADNLEKLPHTIRLSRKAKRIIKQNIVFSLIVKFVALAFIFPGWLTLWIAVLSDTGAALLVIFNSMRLLRMKR
ncbi:heavy metal translocating P-type ATPase [Paenibacillus sp. GYB004]|uniref:heavy metal translocating P-type ATPase n=1 Tax=Paenibacillus sp. GYB004 TaxID=2994393 RepID=UPI002F9653F4